MTDATVFGSTRWAQQRRGGQLTLAETVRETVSAGSVVSPLLARKLTGRARPYRKQSDWNIDDFSAPDSLLARDADEQCREASSPMLYNHAVRTYFWGLMLAKRDGLSFDIELFYLAAMLHDLTLTDTYRHYAPTPCFAARGAQLAADWAREKNLDDDRREVLADAICLHLNPKLAEHHSPEARMPHAGAAVETLGLRAWDLPRSTWDDVLAKYPRHGMKAMAPQIFGAESHARTRARFLVRRGFNVLARAAPFPD